VKNEQFDFLYSSLRATQHQTYQYHETNQLALKERVVELEEGIRIRDEAQVKMQSRLVEAHNQLRNMMESSSSSSSSFSNLPPEVIKFSLLFWIIKSFE